jgi:flagellar biosynthesis protein FlhF
LETPVADFNKMTDYDIMVIDVTAMPDEASQKIAEIKAHVGAKDIGIIATIPGSTSRAMIELTMQRFADLAPMIALTKLDECETTASEFSAYVEQGARISILSGTKSVIGASIFASENILLQYLKENFSNHEAIMPTGKGLE